MRFEFRAPRELCVGSKADDAIFASAPFRRRIKSAQTPRKSTDNKVRQHSLLRPRYWRRRRRQRVVYVLAQLRHFSKAASKQASRVAPQTILLTDARQSSENGKEETSTEFVETFVEGTASGWRSATSANYPSHSVASSSGSGCSPPIAKWGLHRSAIESPISRRASSRGRSHPHD